MTNCNDCQMLLVDYERGELDPARDAAMHQHLQSCAACRERYESDLVLVDSMRAWAGDREFPASILAGVRQAMYADRPPTLAERLRAFLRPVVAAPVAAALLIGVVYVGYHNRATPQPTLTGMDFVREHFAQTAALPSSDRTWSTYVLTSANASSSSDASTDVNH